MNKLNLLTPRNKNQARLFSELNFNYDVYSRLGPNDEMEKVNWRAMSFGMIRAYAMFFKDESAEISRLWDDYIRDYFYG